MKSNFKSTSIGFAIGLAAAGAVAAAQEAQHAHGAPSTIQRGPADSKEQMPMMADPAMHSMMEQMSQCRDMMSNMMAQMEHQRQMPKSPPSPPKR